MSDKKPNFFDMPLKITKESEVSEEVLNFRKANRIREFRKKKGLTQKDLGKLLGISQSHVGLLESGKRAITSDMLFHLSKHLDASPAALIEPNVEPGHAQIVKLPVVSWVQAGALSEAIEDNDIEYITVAYPSPDAFVLRVQGDSMAAAGAKDGSMIIVDRVFNNAIDGKLYVFRHLHSGETGFKRYRNTDGPDRFEPMAYTQDYKTYYPSESEPYEIIGQVTRIILDVD